MLSFCVEQLQKYTASSGTSSRVRPCSGAAPGASSALPLLTRFDLCPSMWYSCADLRSIAVHCISPEFTARLGWQALSWEELPMRQAACTRRSYGLVVWSLFRGPLPGARGSLCCALRGRRGSCLGKWILQARGASLYAAHTCIILIWS